MDKKSVPYYGKIINLKKCSKLNLYGKDREKGLFMACNLEFLNEFLAFYILLSPFILFGEIIGAIIIFYYMFRK